MTERNGTERNGTERNDKYGISISQEVCWKDYYLRDIFTILEPGRSKGLNHLTQDNNGVSYLGATNLNNGVLGFVKPVQEMVQKGNCVAFIRNGEGSMGYAVYKAEDFIATSDMTIGYNDHLNKYIGCYITTIADRIRGKSLLSHNFSEQLKLLIFNGFSHFGNKKVLHN